MFKFFEGIVAFLITAINFIINLFEMVVQVVVNVGRGIAWLFACLSYLPSWLVAFLAVPVALAVIFQIINKGS